MDIGVFCGTFNPIHLGHLLIAECARDQFKLEKVIFVTSPNPPHREETLLEGHKRHELVVAAVSDNPNFEASDLELKRDGLSYTYDTLKQIDTIYKGKANLNLIIGGDNLSQLHDWHRVDELLSLCRILVVPRLRYIKEEDEPLIKIGEEPAKLKNRFSQARVEVVDFPGIAVSGSRIRERIRENKSILYMVPAKVNEIIKRNGLFKEALKAKTGQTNAKDS